MGTRMLARLTFLSLLGLSAILAIEICLAASATSPKAPLVTQIARLHGVQAVSAEFMAERELERHPTIESLREGLLADAKPPCPIEKAPSASVECDPAVVAAIALLGLAVGPSDVTRLVVPIVVDSVDGMILARAPAYIGEKVRKDEPRLADRNSASSVGGVLRIPRVSASLDHVAPRHVLRGQV